MGRCSIIVMASQRCELIVPAIVIIICLDVSSIVATAAAVVWNPKTSRYVGSYNLDKGPVFYEAYYPDTRDAHQEKRRYFDRNTMLETSFQMPFERFVYSETADYPISTNESFAVVVDDKEMLPKEQRKTIKPRRNYDATSHLVSFSNKHSTIFDDDKNLQAANIEEISKLVRRAISRDLENWNALEGYLDRTVHQDRSMPQLDMYSREIHKSGDGSYIFPINNRRFIETDSSKRSNFGALLPRKLDARDAKQYIFRPIYFDGVDESTVGSEMSASRTQAIDTIPPPIDIISNSLPPENIFQPRPQLIRYMFFKRPIPPRLDERGADEQDEKTIDLQSTPPTHNDNLIRQGIIDDKRGRRVGENVKVTSIEISQLPRHKTRHHHGEWLKRDYSIHRHRSQSAAYPTVS